MNDIEKAKKEWACLNPLNLKFINSYKLDLDELYVLWSIIGKQSLNYFGLIPISDRYLKDEQFFKKLKYRRAMKCLKVLEERGYIESKMQDYKGQKTRHYSVCFHSLKKNEILKTLVDENSDQYSTLKDYFSYCSQFVSTSKKNPDGKSTLAKQKELRESSYIREIIEKLNSCKDGYLRRRTNENREKNAESYRIEKMPNIPKTQKYINLIKDCLDVLSKQDINNAHCVFVHDYLNGELNIKEDCWAYLFSKKNDYETIIRYSNKWVSNGWHTTAHG